MARAGETLENDYKLMFETLGEICYVKDVNREWMLVFRKREREIETIFFF